ncbi:MAG: aspartyl/asparaginyl beta-hydroxylase domain-containing protein [Nitrospiria bacterium]
MTYVYRLRGHERYVNLAEYLRKGWPIFTPLNCYLYLFTKRRARCAIMDMEHFRELDEIHEHWQIIRKEVLALYEKGHFERTKQPGENAYYDIGFRTFYKYGWSKFYLKWYGYVHHSAKRLCPETVRILENIPSVKGAMFSILPPGSQLTRHLDPVATSLRYHLGLSTPNSNDCYINVDGKKYSWRDGEAFMFDETYLHFARNNADQNRLILMCDVERPMNILGRIFNFPYQLLMRLTVTPNMEGDRRGLANIVFSGLAPILERTKKLKETHRKSYLALKYSVNTILIMSALALIAGVIHLFAGLFNI